MLNTFSNVFQQILQPFAPRTNLRGLRTNNPLEFAVTYLTIRAESLVFSFLSLLTIQLSSKNYIMFAAIHSRVTFALLCLGAVGALAIGGRRR